MLRSVALTPYPCHAPTVRAIESLQPLFNHVYATAGLDNSWIRSAFANIASQCAWCDNRSTVFFSSLKHRISEARLNHKKSNNSNFLPTLTQDTARVGSLRALPARAQGQAHPPPPELGLPERHARGMGRGGRGGRAGELVRPDGEQRAGGRTVSGHTRLKTPSNLSRVLFLRRTRRLQPVYRSTPPHTG